MFVAQTFSNELEVVRRHLFIIYLIVDVRFVFVCFVFNEIEFSCQRYMILTVFLLHTPCFS